MTDEAKMRESFEREYERFRLVNHPEQVFARVNGDYIVSTVDLHWMMWKACAEQKDKEIAELREKLAAQQAELLRHLKHPECHLIQNTGTEELAAIKAAEWKRGHSDACHGISIDCAYAYERGESVGKQAGRAELDRESARLGAIIESHIDDMTYVLREVGLLRELEEPGILWSGGCHIDRAKFDARRAELEQELMEQEPVGRIPLTLQVSFEADIEQCLRQGVGVGSLLYARPFPQQKPLSDELGDKRDAERFRWLLENCTDFMHPVNGVLTNGRFKYKRGSCFSPREAIDKAMSYAIEAAHGITGEKK